AARRLPVRRRAVEVRPRVGERIGAESGRLVVGVDDVLVHEELPVRDRPQIRVGQRRDRLGILRDPGVVEHPAVDHHLGWHEGHRSLLRRAVRTRPDYPPASFVRYRPARWAATRSRWSPWISITPSFTAPPEPQRRLSSRATSAPSAGGTPSTSVTVLPFRPAFVRLMRTTPSPRAGAGACSTGSGTRPASVE